MRLHSDPSSLCVRTNERLSGGDLFVDSTPRARQWLKLKVMESSCGFLEMSPIGFGVRAREAKMWQKWQITASRFNVQSSLMVQMKALRIYCYCTMDETDGVQGAGAGVPNVAEPHIFGYF